MDLLRNERLRELAKRASGTEPLDGPLITTPELLSLVSELAARRMNDTPSGPFPIPVAVTSVAFEAGRNFEKCRLRAAIICALTSARDILSAALDDRTPEADTKATS